MKKIRKIGIMFLVLAISISVIACGNQNKSKKVNDFSSKTEKESEEKLKQLTENFTKINFLIKNLDILILLMNLK